MVWTEQPGQLAKLSTDPVLDRTGYSVLRTGYSLQPTRYALTPLRRLYRLLP